MSEENPYAAPAAEVQPPPIDATIPGSQNYASLGERFMGSLVDGLITLVIPALSFVLLVPVLVSGSMANKGFLEKMAEIDELEITIIVVVMTFASMAVQWPFWSSSSQSIGKKVMKTQIVNLDGTPASVTTIAFKRYLVISLRGLIPGKVGEWIGIIDVLMVFRKERNCLHDDIAKTRVIKKPMSQ